MSYEELIDAVEDGAGLSSRAEAKAAVTAVFGALATRVLPGDRRVLIALLPPPLAALFDGDEQGAEESLDRIVEEVAEAEQIRDGFGREHLDVVGAAVAATLHPDAVAALRNHLPAAVASIFTPKPKAGRVERPTPLEVPAQTGRHLADARPGGAHPVSEASAERAHSESVARSDDPHGDTKLSGAKGLTQEREGESLAEGEE